MKLKIRNRNIVLDQASTYAFAKTFRDAIDIALDKQREWSFK